MRLLRLIVVVQMLQDGLRVSKVDFMDHASAVWLCKADVVSVTHSLGDITHTHI